MEVTALVDILDKLKAFESPAMLLLSLGVIVTLWRQNNTIKKLAELSDRLIKVETRMCDFITSSGWKADGHK